MGPYYDSVNLARFQSTTLTEAQWAGAKGAGANEARAPWARTQGPGWRGRRGSGGLVSVLAVLALLVVIF